MSRRDSNLLKDLYGDIVDSTELESVLVTHFGRARQLSMVEYCYGRTDKSYSLKLHYDGHLLTTIKEGPEWKPADLVPLQNKIQATLLSSAQNRAGRFVGFTALPTKGAYRFRDVFQVLPVPEDAPQPPIFLGEHPFLVEFQYPSVPDTMVDGLRRTRKGREIELLLCVLLPFHAFSHSQSVTHQWVLGDPPSQPGQVPSSQFRQIGYSWPGLSNLARDQFSDIRAIPPLARCPAQEHFTRSGIGFGQVVSLPDTIDVLCEKAFALRAEDRGRFFRACYWYQHAYRVATLSSSAMFTALVSAVEALLPPISPTMTCDSCKRSIGPGPTARFAEFVDQYAPNITTTSSDRRKFYEIRSKLSHGGSLLHRDQGFFGPSLNPASMKEWSDMERVRHIARIVLVNWLMQR